MCVGGSANKKSLRISSRRWPAALTRSALQPSAGQPILQRCSGSWLSPVTSQPSTAQPATHNATAWVIGFAAFGIVIRSIATTGLGGRTFLGKPPTMRRRRLKSLAQPSGEKTRGNRSQRAGKSGALSDQGARGVGLDEVINGLRHSGRLRHSCPQRRRFNSGDSRCQRRKALDPSRDLRPYRERPINLGQRNDIARPLGGVGPHGPYILGACRAVG
jgi:hypothetical protein